MPLCQCWLWATTEVDYLRGSLFVTCFLRSSNDAPIPSVTEAIQFAAGSHFLYFFFFSSAFPSITVFSRGFYIVYSNLTLEWELWADLFDDPFICSWLSVIFSGVFSIEVWKEKLLYSVVLITLELNCNAFSILGFGVILYHQSLLTERMLEKMHLINWIIKPGYSWTFARVRIL